MLIGAGGHFCPVARYLGARHATGAPVVVAQEAEFEVDPQDVKDLDAEVPELFFCRDLRGYGWCFRKGNFLNIGLGRIDSNRLSEHVSEFCEFLRRERKITCDLPGHFLGHAYQLYERAEPKLVDDGILLIGDAAGLAYANSGEGIRPAVESGLIAAEVILEANGNFDVHNLRQYQARLVQRLGPPPKRTVNQWLPAAWLHGVATRLMRTRWFAKKVVVENWFLHSGQPALEPMP
jgi:flavin-dependent dehydrogenase